MADERKIPALFATIHFHGPERANGYTADDIRRLNLIANGIDPDDSAAEQAWLNGETVKGP